MAFASATDKLWPVPPDWSNGVQESLGWSTDLLRASATAVSQHRGLRVGPRRQLSFELLANAQHRRVADMLLAGYSGTWQLPFWPDVQWLGAAVSAGATSIPCATAGYDYVAGGRAVLHAGVNAWEVLEIDTVEADHLVLASATVGAFAAGSRLYPVRTALVQPSAEERLFTDDMGRRRLVFDIAEASDWPELASPTTYLTHPVLDVRPDESEDPTSSYDRMLQSVDYGLARPLVYDLPDQALRLQRSHWKLFGRAEHSWFRSLLYTLQGRRVPIWVPSFASDLRPVAAVAGGSAALSVEWAGYTLFGYGRHNRRDLRIELVDGTVLYRRVIAAGETSDTENLTLDASLDAGSIPAASIRAVSFMALSTLASDEVEITHATDQEGVATATTGWQAVVPDV